MSARSTDRVGGFLEDVMWFIPTVVLFVTMTLYACKLLNDLFADYEPVVVFETVIVLFVVFLMRLRAP